MPSAQGAPRGGDRPGPRDVAGPARRAGPLADAGDYGRLQSVFEQLESESIVARMWRSCCGTCAYHDIASEATWVADGGIRGWLRVLPSTGRVRTQLPRAGGVPGLRLVQPPRCPRAIRSAATAGDEAAMDEALTQTDVMVGTRASSKSPRAMGCRSPGQVGRRTHRGAPAPVAQAVAAVGAKTRARESACAGRKWASWDYPAAQRFSRARRRSRPA